MALSPFRLLAPGICSFALIVLLPSPTLPAQTSDTASTAVPDDSSISLSLSISPSTISLGEQTTISWTSSNASSASMNGAAVPPTGTYTVAPSQTLPFTLTVTGRGGTAMARSLVTVNAAASAAPTSPSTVTGATSSGTPHISYTDLNVGGGTGGDNGNGVYVRIFGSHFGNAQGSGSVTLGGKLITNCRLCSWTDKRIIAQLGGAARTGSIVVTANGLSSNGLPFTVTPTDIFFVATNGSDNNQGTFASPFRTWRAAFNKATSGDNTSPPRNTVLYLEPGVNVNDDDGRGYRATMSTDLGGRSPSSQLAIVGFPGGVAKVGSTQVENGIHGWGKYITIADLTITGANSAIDNEAGYTRIINNDISCPAPPSGLGSTACVLAETEDPSATWVFQGNNVHDTGGNVDKTYHAVYFSSNVNHADVGWNSIGQNFKGYCRSLLFHATEGSNQSDLHIHDNMITGGYCDAVGLGSVDPSKGTVEVYNNVIAHVAVASNPYGTANEAGIAVNSDPAGSSSGVVQIFNNTVVDAGAYTAGHQNGCFGIVTGGAGMNLVNNICLQPNPSEPYIESGSQNVTGSHNAWYGAGSPPSWDAAPITAAPGFASSTSFVLQSTSPDRQKGLSSKTSIYDITGTRRASPPSVGAYE